MPNIKAEKLRKLCIASFTAAGVSREEAEIVLTISSERTCEVLTHTESETYRDISKR